MKKILAKSNGVTLIEHSSYVAERALYILEEMYLEESDYYFDADEKKVFIDIVKVSALLHDIGKCTTAFQENLKSKNETRKDVFLHNEIGWAFLEKYLKFDSSYKHFVTDCVLYHHGIKNYPKTLPTSESILDTISISDKNIMKKYLTTVLSKDYLKEVTVDYVLPKYYGENVLRDDINEDIKKMFFRTILVSADRMIDTSSQSNIYRENPLYNLDTFDKNERLDNQIKISEDKSKNLIVNAAAGFGKTLTGLLWNIKSSDKKLIWVCPRNTVAESVYYSILSELENINCNLKVELFLTSETKKKNHNDTEEFNSDIIITNIDNFLSPNLKNPILSRLYYIAKCDVVFDEYHEFITREAYFSLFTNMLKMRTMFTNSKTMLLSATPINIHSIIDPTLKCTKILPSENTHYPSAHSKEYKVSLIDYGNVEVKDNSLYVFNNVSNSQRFKFENNKLDLFHSKFENKKKEEMFDSIYKTYNKKSSRNIVKNSLCSTLIIQASIDISFNHLYESVMSHLATAQRIGRVNRWGDISEECTINIFKSHNHIEKETVSKLYNTELMDSWYTFLESKDIKYITLDEFYELYNEYSVKEVNAFSKYLSNVHRESLANLKKISFVYTKSSKSESDIIKSGSNKLRCSNAQVFYICKRECGTWSDPFTKSVTYGFDQHFKETSKTLSNIKKTIKSLKGDDRFDYGNKYKNDKMTIDSFRRCAVFSNTPYITYNNVYSETYGLIDKKMLETFV